MSKTARKDGGLPSWGAWRDYWVRVGDEPFLDRKVLVICPWFGVFVSKIHQPDQQRDPHDHSRPFVSLILSGHYTEMVWSDPRNMNYAIPRVHSRWSVHRMRTNQAHVITNVTRPLWTLLIAGKSRGTWSFWTDRGMVDWKEYGK